MTEKRGRGRPVGTGKNDAPFLADIADLLVRTPEMKPTAAMRRVLEARKHCDAASREAMIRRLQAKWKTSSATELAAARRRAEPKPAATTRVVRQPSPAYDPMRAFGLANPSWQADAVLQQVGAIKGAFEATVMSGLINEPAMAFQRQIDEIQRSLSFQRQIDEIQRSLSFHSELVEMQRSLAYTASFLLGPHHTHLPATRAATGFL